jgi:hypothetical protein
MMTLSEFDITTDRFVKVCFPNVPVRGTSADNALSQLMDCKHVFEVEGLDNWMRSQGESDSVQLPCCPNCRTPIRQTYRYATRPSVASRPPNANVSQRMCTGTEMSSNRSTGTLSR